MAEASTSSFSLPPARSVNELESIAFHDNIDKFSTSNRIQEAIERNRVEKEEEISNVIDDGREKVDELIKEMGNGMEEMDLGQWGKEDDEDFDIFALGKKNSVRTRERERGRGRGKGKNNRKRKNKKNKERKKEKQSRMLPSEWPGVDTDQRVFYYEEDVKNEKNNNNNNNVPPPPKDLCKKKRLMVDFADIGWNEWIISPKSFEADYCAGECPFPMSRVLNPSNHATIQGIVHAVGLHSHVPAPCCVPTAMTSVTLLYFDEDLNVVLKNYPNMSVTSCGCR